MVALCRAASCGVGQQVVAIVLLLGLAIPVALCGLLFILLLVLHLNFH